QSVRHHSPSLTGVAITVTTLSWAGGAWVQARLASQREGRGLVAVGVSLVIAGTAGLAATLFSSIPAWLVVPAWAVAGLGMGLAHDGHGVVGSGDVEHGWCRRARLLKRDGLGGLGDRRCGHDRRKMLEARFGSHRRGESLVEQRRRRAVDVACAEDDRDHRAS